jgi:endo-1,4-beta-xylanase
MILSLNSLLQTLSANRLRSACIAICIFLFVSGVFAYRTAKIEERNVMGIQQTTTIINTNPTDLLQGQWKFMPGMQKVADGYTITGKEFAIVEQDGKTAQLNPPVNLAGTHLASISGDFTITAQIKAQTATQEVIQLYGRAPIIADEFRVERESMQMIIERGMMTVKIWNGKSQNSTVRAMPYTAADTIDLKIARVGKNIQVSINNKQIGSISDSGLFKSGEIWFGFDGKNGSWLLSQLQIEKKGNGSLTVADASTTQITNHNTTGLQALAVKKRSGFIVGGAMALGPLTTDPTYASVALDKNTFGSMTPENGMKMINLQPQRGVYTFEQADALVQLAKQNGLTVHGHTLVFAEANPPWFTLLPVTTIADKQAIENIMTNHIQTVVSHFKNAINSWDVINEPLADYPEFEAGQTMRNHKWYQAMGESYIIKALDTAHKANPNATLFINEYGLEDDGERWDAFINLLTKLKPQLQAHNIPLDKMGVGFQSHIYEASDRIDPSILQNHIKQLEKLGFKSQISEMDVYSDDGDAVQAQQYKNVFLACINQPNCIAWRTWIISDRYDYWKDDNGNIQTGVDGLFDTNIKARPGYTLTQQLLEK